MLNRILVALVGIPVLMYVYYSGGLPLPYSEIYITDKYWPDFDEVEMEKAILSYSKRERRFGGRLDVK